MSHRGVLLLIALLTPTVGSAQAEPIDQGTLVIRVADVEVGRELFTLQAGRRGGLTGSTLKATASYPGVRPRVRVNGVLERGSTQSLSAFQLDLDGPAPQRTVGELVRDRLTVRNASPTRESAREYPGGPDVVVLDDSVHSFWLAVADLATESGTPLRIVEPRSGWRGHLVVKRVRVPNGPPIISITGDIEGTVLLDASGKFSGLLIPGKHLEVLRQSQ